MMPDAVTAGTGERAEVPVHDAEALTRGGSSAIIILNGQSYTLRITRQGKLLLTK